jgi:hypothetical protein
VIKIGDIPPSWPQMYVQLQPLSRLISMSFSVSSALVMDPSSYTKHMVGQHWGNILKAPHLG